LDQQPRCGGVFRQAARQCACDIDRLRGSPEISGDWFREVHTTDEQNGQSYRSLDVTRDGFTLLAFGYTGARAIPASTGLLHLQSSIRTA
jgi:phage regulator Rha-like protein